MMIQYKQHAYTKPEPAHRHISRQRTNLIGNISPMILACPEVEVVGEVDQLHCEQVAPLRLAIAALDLHLANHLHRVHDCLMSCYDD